MNKTIIFMSLFLLALAPALVLGATPVYQGGFTLNDTNISSSPLVYRDGTSFAYWGDYVAVEQFYKQGLAGKFLAEIYNWRTGGKVFEVVLDDLDSCQVAGSSLGNNHIKYRDGNLFFGKGFSCNAGKEGVLAVYDVTNIGFISQRTHIKTTPNIAVNGLYEQLLIYESNGVTADFLILGHNYHLNATDGLEELNQLGSGEPYPIFIDEQNEHFVDENGIETFQDNGYDIYSFNSGDLTDETLSGSVEVNSGSIIDWNRNFLNPEYITDEGHILLVGGSDYDDFKTSSLALSFEPLFFFERDNIIGIVDNVFWSADMSDLGNIIETNTGVVVNADIIKREDDNKIITFNTTTNVYSIYEVPLPTFISEPQAETNTPPTKTLEFLGVDNNERFIFLGEFNDVEGGLIFEALSVGTPPEQQGELYVKDTISHNKIATRENIISECESDTHFNGDLQVGQRILEFPTYVDQLTYGTWCNLKHDHRTISSLETNNLQIRGEFAVVGDGNNEYTSVYLTDNEDNIMLIVGFIFLNDGVDGFDNVSVEILGDGTTSLIVDQATLNYDEGSIINYVFDIDFFDKSVNVSLWEYDTYTGYPIAKDYFIQDYNANFRDSLVEDFSNIYFNAIGSIHEYYIGGTIVQYDNPLTIFPDYEVVGDLDAGETSIVTLRSGISSGLDVYQAYLYATDNDLGLEYYENPYVLTFRYSEETEILSEEQIANALQEAQTGANDGFKSVGVVEGDLVTDTFFGFLDDWNIKTTASKFMVGLFLIMVLIALGGWLGTLAKSSLVSGIGALMGALGGLFMVTYWGLFPVWVTFSITLIGIVLIANMVRNGLTGSGGS